MKPFASPWPLLRSQWLRFSRAANDPLMLLWAVPAGVLGALATEVFRHALTGLEHLILGSGGSLVAIARQLAPWQRVVIPTAGGLAAGLLLVWAAKRAGTQPKSDYMEAIVLGDGRIPVGNSLLRSSASMLSIASGGSLGREGSMAQLAALSASLLGRWLQLPPDRLRLLVACGAAAGITSAYSAPVAGVFFVAEVVLGSLAMETLGPIIVASAVANITVRGVTDYHPLYLMPTFPTVAGWEVSLFAVLGLLAGGAAALFLRSLALSRKLFERLPVPLPLPLRLALGGLVVGLLSLRWPEMWGNGFSVVSSVLHSPWSVPVLLTLLLAKLVATSATVGSGAVGGIFTPSLFFGCLMGAVFGQAMHGLLPHTTAAPFAYAIVGMGAFLAGATQAPLMAMLMVFEMTQSYQVMLPLMVACVLAFWVARSANVGAMYDVTWRRLARRDEQRKLQTLQMHQLVQPALTVVLPDAGLDAMGQLFAQYPVKYLYVTDAPGHYLGVVPLKNLSVTAEGAPSAQTCAADVMGFDITPLTADMSLAEALQHFLDHPGERLPVVDNATPPVLLGVVSKSSLLTTYAQLSA